MGAKIACFAAADAAVIDKRLELVAGHVADHSARIDVAVVISPEMGSAEKKKK